MSKSKSTLPTGKEVDTYLRASPLINKYIEDKLKQGLRAEGRLYILTAEQFRQKLVEYLQNFNNPETGSHYTAEEAEEEEAYIEAFQDIMISNI